MMRLWVLLLCSNLLATAGMAQEVYHFTQNTKVHSLPNSTAKVVAQAKQNAELTYLKTMESGDWAKIKYKGTIGYVLVSVIEPGKYEQEVKEVSKTTYHVSIYQTHLYLKRDASSAKLATYRKDDEVQVVDVVGEWYKVQDGTKVGYILASHLKEGSAPEAGTETLTTTPYEVTAGQAKVFAKPDGSAKVLSKHYKGDLVDFVKVTQDGKWAKLRTTTGFGYILMSNIKESEQTSSGGGGGDGQNPDAIGTSQDPVKIGAVCRDGAMVKGGNHDVCAKHNGVKFWIYTKKR